MLSWLIALLLALAAFAAISAWLWSFGRRQETQRHGLAGIAGMQWREFAHIVRRALSEKRGFQALSEQDDMPAEPSTEWLMRQADGQPVLVCCKHGTAYRIGEAAVNELGAKLRLSNARSGLLLTEGLVHAAGRELALRQSIDVVDARSLWPLLRDYVPAELEAAATAHARSATLRRTGIALLGSVTFGLAMGMGHLTVQPEPPPPAPAPVSAAPARPDPAPTAAPDAAVAAPPALLIDGVDPTQQNPDPATLRIYQQQVSRLLSSTEGLKAAIWLTQLTLTVDREVDDARALALICPVLHQYPSLRTVRVQLNPRPGVEEPVRWRQCSTI